MKMTEEFIYYLWKMNLLYGELFSTDGQPISIINSGIRNEDSGPDFFNARLKIGDTEWAGNVEMHTTASDWLRHGHNDDRAYDSVILHVVYECDTEITNKNSELIPCLVIKGHYDESLYFKYRNLVSGRDWIACASNIAQVGDIHIFNFLDRILIDRLERKTAAFEKILEETNGNWEDTFYITLARNFGFNTNSQPFEMLARALPLAILTKHKEDVFQMEALLFGQAGLLNDRLDDDYSKKLVKEYSFLRKKYGLENVKAYAWKFMRMRPVNFPTIRISQFAQLIHKSNHLLSKILEIDKLENLKSYFEVEVSEYWLTHFTFGPKSKSRSKSLGEDSFNLILINTIVPFLFVYGKHHDNQFFIDRAILFLQQTRAESNGIVRRWAATGVKATNASNSQALLSLKNDYCDNILCLNCAIGNSILRS
ncbi:MAG: hypothetical protein AUJ98_09510 [Bacteroidetes bacterium CG2_30_33_31]|nr:MAG: hypothetical protein AUJ98_09510 [Bacteroidetes bacterium CG2_30_33_31]